MYANPKDIRNVRVNLSLSDAENRAAEAIAEMNGMQKSAYLRQCFLEKIYRDHGGDSGFAPLELRAA